MELWRVAGDGRPNKSPVRQHFSALANRMRSIHVDCHRLIVFLAVTRDTLGAGEGRLLMSARRPRRVPRPLTLHRHCINRDMSCARPIDLGNTRAGNSDARLTPKIY